LILKECRCAFFSGKNRLKTKLKTQNSKIDSLLFTFEFYFLLCGHAQTATEVLRTHIKTTPVV
jgi:hypothetical protein